MNPDRFLSSRSSSGKAGNVLILTAAILASTSLIHLGEEAATSSARTALGNEIFCRSFPLELEGKRLGLVINQTSVLPGGQMLLDRLLTDGHRVTAIFTPEHGLRGVVEGGREVAESSWKGIRVHSLYGKQLHPSAEQLEEVDALIYDIQDVGTRFYTYITTLKYVLEAAAQAGLSFYVLDRPNPLGGRYVEGPLLKPGYESLIAALPVPIRYGLTAGELALMMRGEGWVPTSARLKIVCLTGWTRNQTWKSTGLLWIPPSPNIPTPESAFLYPGIGLLGGINLNQGLGTSLPFLQFGAPWIDASALAARLSREKELGARLERVAYTPSAMPGRVMTPPYRDRLCQGLRVRVLDEAGFRSLRFVLRLVKTLKDLYPDRIFVRSEALNQMFGDDTLSLFIGGSLTFETLIERLEADERLFLEKRRRYLLYPDQ